MADAKMQMETQTSIRNGNVGNGNGNQKKAKLIGTDAPHSWQTTQSHANCS
jgi:hypothetical protein